MPRPRNAIQSSLKQKGFQEKEKTNHRYYHFVYDDKITSVSTFVSRGTKYKEISDDILSRMWKQLGLNKKKELLDLVDCPMGKEELISVLQAKGILPPE